MPSAIVCFLKTISAAFDISRRSLPRAQTIQGNRSGGKPICVLYVQIMTAGTHGNCVRLLMPLVITDEQLAEAFEVLEAGLSLTTELQ